jgi:hypothetical protein
VFKGDGEDVGVRLKIENPQIVHYGLPYDDGVLYLKPDGGFEAAASGNTSNVLRTIGARRAKRQRKV